MANIPTFRRFSAADYPTAPNWLGAVFGPLNLFCEQTVNSMNKNLTIGQNVQGLKYSTTFTTLSSYATGGFTPISFAYNGIGSPNCLLIGKISKSDNTNILKSVSITHWDLNTNYSPYQIVVNYIAGLDPSTKYNITFLAL